MRRMKQKSHASIYTPFHSCIPLSMTKIAQNVLMTALLEGILKLANRKDNKSLHFNKVHIMMIFASI